MLNGILQFLKIHDMDIELHTSVLEECLGEILDVFISIFLAIKEFRLNIHLNGAAMEFSHIRCAGRIGHGN